MARYRKIEPVEYRFKSEFAVVVFATEEIAAELVNKANAKDLASHMGATCTNGEKEKTEDLRLSALFEEQHKTHERRREEAAAAAPSCGPLLEHTNACHLNFGYLALAMPEWPLKGKSGGGPRILGRSGVRKVGPI